MSAGPVTSMKMPVSIESPAATRPGHDFTSQRGERMIHSLCDQMLGAATYTRRTYIILDNICTYYIYIYVCVCVFECNTHISLLVSCSGSGVLSIWKDHIGSMPSG